jgi:hypothetical protein
VYCIIFLCPLVIVVFYVTKPTKLDTWVPKLMSVLGFRLSLVPLSILPCLPRRVQEHISVELGCVARVDIHPVSLEELQCGPVHLVIRFSVQVRVWVRSCLAGITERWSTVYDHYRYTSLHTLVQRNCVSSRNGSVCESAASWNVDHMAVFRGGGCAVFSLLPLAWDHSKQDYGHVLWKPVYPSSSPQFALT